LASIFECLQRARSILPCMCFFGVLYLCGLEAEASFLPLNSITECSQKSLQARRYEAPGKPVRSVGRFFVLSGVKRDLGVYTLYTKTTLLLSAKSGTVVSVLDPKITNLKSLKSAPTIPPSPTVPLFVFAGWHN